MTLLTAKQLGDKYDISHQAVTKKMARHGFLPNKNKQYDEVDFLKAQKQGAEMDKTKLSNQLSTDGKPTLTHLHLQRKIKKLDIEIQIAQAQLDETLGKSISLEKHKADILTVQNLMMTWYDQTISAIATKRKDAGLLNELRQARDKASDDIMEVL